MSSSAPAPSAPDLSGNIANANATFGTATSDATQTMNTAKSLNAASQANLAGVTANNNSMAGAIANTANENLNTYGSNFVGLQQQEAQAAAQYGSTDNINRLTGQAIGNVNSANQAARQNSAAALASEGVDPASVHGAALDRQQSIAGAGQAANAGTAASIGAQQQAFQMENTANALGTQVGQMGTSGAATSANVMDQGQNTINSTNAGNISNLTAANSYLNTGISANNSAMTGQQDQFNDQMASYNANQQSSAGAGQMLGQVAGIAAMAMMEEGGPVPSPIPTNYSLGGNVTARGALPRSPIPGSTDTKPALLTPGEFVIPKDVVDFKGQDYFHRQIDSIRQAKNKRLMSPIPHAPHVSMHS